MDKLISSEFLERFRQARSAKEWNALCDEVKLTYGGYPSDWYEKVMASGLAATVQMGWQTK